MKKNLRKQIFASVMEAKNDNLIGLSDILSGNEHPEEIMNKVCTYLDDNCGNGYFSRWTEHGNSIYNDAVKLAAKLEAKYASMNL
jgi:hypothetical protein